MPTMFTWLHRLKTLRWLTGEPVESMPARATGPAAASVSAIRKPVRGASVVAKPGPEACGIAPMAPDRVRDARLSLRRILDCHPAAPRIWPSIVLVDRAMGRYAGEGIDRLSPQVLHDAVIVLNRLMDEFCEFGLIVLLERIDCILRVVHGTPSSAVARWNAVRPAEIQVLEATITEFMEIDREWDQHLLVEQEAAPRKQAS